MGAHRIELSESLRFAALSGDFNPLHVDPIRARRLPFGATVVHGISVLFRALDDAFKSHGGGSFTHVKADFDMPILTGQDFTIKSAREEQTLTVAVRTARGLAQRIIAELAPDAMQGPAPASPITQRICRELDFEAASVARGAIPLSLDGPAAAGLYPSLARLAPGWQLAALAATTRLVGMECPGLHSVYTALDAQFTPADPTAAANLDWNVARTDKRFKLLRLEMNGAGFTGKISALVRPAPVAQPSFAEVRGQIPAGKFAGRRALVIGASRGLGEVAAKIIAAGGGDVMITYAHGAGDAEAIVADIKSGGGKAAALAFDALDPPTAGPDGWTPTDLLYFASPQISLNPGAPWDEALFQRFCAYFVTGFARAVETVDSAFGAAKQNLRIFYPSTIYVSEPAAGAAEYAAAKGAAETLCATIAAQRPQTEMHAPRLPRVLTDQTSSVRSGPMAQPFDVLRDCIR